MQITTPTQIGFTFDAPAAAAFVDPRLAYCPANLLPDLVVALDEPSLSMTEDDCRAYLRSRMTPDQLKAEICAISELGNARMEFGMWGLLGLKESNSGYACIDSGESALNWMHGHERQRLNQLKLALPTNGDEVQAARARVQARIAARKAAAASN